MNGINLGKQLHSKRSTKILATPQGANLLTIPREAFIYDILVDNKNQLPPEYYGEGRISIGVPGNKEYIARATDISKGGVIRCELGPGAGYQPEDIHLRLFWLYTGKGQPSSGPVMVLVLFDLS